MQVKRSSLEGYFLFPYQQTKKHFSRLFQTAQEPCIGNRCWLHIRLKNAVKTQNIIQHTTQVQKFQINRKQNSLTFNDCPSFSRKMAPNGVVNKTIGVVGNINRFKSNLSASHIVHDISKHFIPWRTLVGSFGAEVDGDGSGPRSLAAARETAPRLPCDGWLDDELELSRLVRLLSRGVREGSKGLTVDRLGLGPSWLTGSCWCFRASSKTRFSAVGVMSDCAGAASVAAVPYGPSPGPEFSGSRLSTLYSRLCGGASCEWLWTCDAPGDGSSEQDATLRISDQQTDENWTRMKEMLQSATNGWKRKWKTNLILRLGGDRRPEMIDPEKLDGSVEQANASNNGFKLHDKKVWYFLFCSLKNRCFLSFRVWRETTWSCLRKNTQNKLPKS